MRSAIFLDRDGTINVEKNYLYKQDDWEWIPGSIEAIKGFNELGFLVIVATNQSGVARGLYSQEDVHRLHSYVDRLLAETGARIDAYYYCPHHPDYGDIRECPCRKPRPGLLLKAQHDYNIDLNSSFMIGDKFSDILTGQTVGTAAILVATGYGRYELSRLKDQTVITAEDLYEAYGIIKVRLSGKNTSKYFFRERF